MAFVIADRVRETSTTTGAGNFTLAGAVTGYQTFDTVLDTGDTTYYTIADQSGANWEVGIGTFTSPSTLTRTTILSSSNGGSIVTFTAGTKDVFISLPASKTNTNDQPNVIAVNSTSNALRITQTGTGNALVVEDSANPDATPFVVNASGDVGIGNTAANVNDQVGGVRPLLVSKGDSSTTVAGSLASIVVGNADTTTNNSAQLSFAALTGVSTTYFASSAINCIFGARTNGQYPTGQLVFSTSTALNQAPTEKMRIDASGEVYIAGTTDQGAYNLQVNGTGVWGAGAYVNGSDARIKDDIAPLASGLDVVAKLKPVQFRYKESWSKDTALQPGFIAQDLQAALADQPYVEGVVLQGPEYMSVAYQALIPLLTKAIQELKADFDAYKAAHP